MFNFKDKTFWFITLNLIFIGLCCLHYFSPRGLWLDEILILENIQTKSYAALFGPLDNAQAFPRVYLVCIKWIAEFFQCTDPEVLRFLPFLCMVAGVLTFLFTLYRYTSSTTVFVLTAFAMAVSYKMSYYASEFKPYSMDVLVVAAFARGFLYQKENGGKNPLMKDYLMAALLPLLLFFSYAGLFVFWILVWNYFLQQKTHKSTLGLFWVSLISSVICFGVFFQIDLRHSMNDNGLHDYWTSYFIATSSAAGFFDTLGDGIKKLVTYWYGTSKFFIRAAVIFIPFFLYSLFYLGAKRIKEDRFSVMSLESVGLVLFGQLVVLGFLHKYPFTGERITLFFAPFAMYLTVKGIDALKSPKWLKSIFLAYFGLFCAVCLGNTIWQHWKFF